MDLILLSMSLSMIDLHSGKYTLCNYVMVYAVRISNDECIATAPFEWQVLHVYVDRHIGTAIWSMNLLTQWVSVVMNAVNNNVEQPKDIHKCSVYYQLCKEAKRWYNEKLDMLHLKADPYIFLWRVVITFGLKLNLLIFTTIWSTLLALVPSMYCTDGWVDRVMSYAIERGSRHQSQLMMNSMTCNDN